MATSRSNMEEQIQERIASDPQFRESFKNDPRGALEQTFAVRLPAEVSIKVVENTPDTYYVVLPEQAGSQELSDEALESVAGGCDLSW